MRSGAPADTRGVRGSRQEGPLEGGRGGRPDERPAGRQEGEVLWRVRCAQGQGGAAAADSDSHEDGARRGRRTGGSGRLTRARRDKDLGAGTSCGAAEPGAEEWLPGPRAGRGMARTEDRQRWFIVGGVFAASEWAKASTVSDAQGNAAGGWGQRTGLVYTQPPLPHSKHPAGQGRASGGITAASGRGGGLVALATPQKGTLARKWQCLRRVEAAHRAVSVQSPLPQHKHPAVQDRVSGEVTVAQGGCLRFLNRTGHASGCLGVGLVAVATLLQRNVPSCHLALGA